MIWYLIFDHESNQLCKSLELSAVGVRLAVEDSYQGEEWLLIQSGQHVDFRKPGRLHSLKDAVVRNGLLSVIVT